MNIFRKEGIVQGRFDKQGYTPQTYRITFLIDGDWYSLITKYPDHLPKEGDPVSLQFTTKPRSNGGEFLNIVLGTLRVTQSLPIPSTSQTQLLNNQHPLVAKISDLGNRLSQLERKLVNIVYARLDSLEGEVANLFDEFDKPLFLHNMCPTTTQELPL